MDLFELTRTLIDIPSVSGEEEMVGRFPSDYLQSLGFIVERQQIAPTRANIIATMGAHLPRVMLSTHMDTVPPHIPSGEDEDFITGRGSCDAKGIIAAQVFAARRLIEEGVEDVGLLFTVDEEQASLGAHALNAHPLARSCRYLINGEPTDNLLAVGSKGSLRIRVHTEGRAAHSAYPERGESAIEKLLDVLADVRACRWPVEDFFGATTCNIGVIAGGTRTNVVPASAQADLHFRLVTDSGVVKSMLETIVRERGVVEYLSVSEPVRMLALEGFEQCVVRFTTDITYLSNWGTPLLLGPGSIFDAHTESERVSKRELKKAVELYVRMVRALLAEDNVRAHQETVRAGLR
ncbi:MAG TPA: M20/M25/M40 family metallo-hydrolase [Pyrinomonadaceae bacterium]|nr:M20/M25/M40 family metallo-hydrolase [Pyrinomonadaceae bacterium]